MTYRRHTSGRRMTMSLAGKAMFISGASGGIGLAIATRAAADGAQIALVVKTAELHPSWKAPSLRFIKPINSLRFS
jgi:hypothetical protein